MPISEKEEKRRGMEWKACKPEKDILMLKKDILMIYLCWWKQICKEFMAAQAELCGRAKAR